MRAACLLLLLLPLVSAQQFGWGPCPCPRVQSDLDIDKFTGVWYEIEKIPTSFSKGTSVKGKYEKIDDETFNVVYSMIVKGRTKKAEGIVKILHPEEPAKLGISVSYKPFRPFWVLCTNYTKYAIVYSCRDYHLFHKQFVWILGRSCSLSPHLVQKAKDRLEQEGIDTSSMTATEQHDDY
ncbi:apolipoprotein D-like [Odontesthes bonariensis]|uniref:apolipoprotein D-like n=1 Tax=Odontesthes bonariensis TaxID=219752 RepID=UPI003F586A3B